MLKVTRTVLVLGTLCAAACTVSSEAEIAAAGASIAKLPQVKPLPHKKIPQQPINICQAAPDLSVENVTADDRGFRGWMYVCAPVKNAGGRAWTSNADQVGLSFTSTVPNSGTGRASGFSTLATGATTTRCGWVRAPGMLRTGHDTPSWGECRATKTVSAKLVFDPDIKIDGNKGNDDCRSTNDSKTVTLNYMVSCPW